jgi:hypothetical protein
MVLLAAAGADSNRLNTVQFMAGYPEPRRGRLWPRDRFRTQCSGGRLRGLSRGPTSWRDRHQALAAAYRTWATEVSPDDAWADSQWRDLRLEAAYYLLCSDPSGELTSALTDLAYALDQDRAVAAQWAQMITQAGEDTGAAAVADSGRRLGEALSGTGWHAVFSCADMLLRGSAISGPAVRLAQLLRGCGSTS